MNGLFFPTEGEVNIYGKDSRIKKNLWEIRKQVGMILPNVDNQIVKTGSMLDPQSARNVFRIILELQRLEMTIIRLPMRWKRCLLVNGY